MSNLNLSYFKLMLGCVLTISKQPSCLMEPNLFINGSNITCPTCMGLSINDVSLLSKVCLSYLILFNLISYLVVVMLEDSLR